MALRVMFDTNAYDAILAAGDAARIRDLIGQGTIEVIVTSIQEDEIRQIRDSVQQQKLLEVFRGIGGRAVDPARVIAGDITYMARDEMLARIAASCCDLLVSDDRRIATSNIASYAAFAERTGLRKPASR